MRRKKLLERFADEGLGPNEAKQKNLAEFQQKSYQISLIPR